ncbi:hypothetical protein ISN45_Aa01g018710 [Arabidopsis thaliana x Arabidopsis arenosa]|uniref:Anther-specific protein BCP1 n=1 Tax=Arabidopsis thaliana x Arabidopsis arenosa TaxID=1240361 RepID=A0A8T2C082_9BRAS|nr:hypothetical protein ISN45_Aa01g018710 [Arabidopsis thaliana x Arabidopsis arenosa]
MGRQNVVVVVALVFMAILGLAAAASSPSPSASPSKAPAASKTDQVEAPVTDDQIGTTDDDAAPTPGDGDVAVAGPLGSDSSYANVPSGSTDSADSGAAALGVSAVVVGVTSIAGSFLLF